MTGHLILCATPIGNLGDVSARLGEALAAADVLYAEDTRRTAKLLSHLGIDVPMRSFFAGNERLRLGELEDLLAAGSTVALVSDAGMPTVSDPGATAVACAESVGATVSVIPGPSAVTAALAVSGMTADRFVFEGFLPRKGSARRDVLAGLALEERTIVLFAATSRIGKDLVALAQALGDDRGVVVARELTKVHEEIWRGNLGEAATVFIEPDRARGEFTIVVAGATPRGSTIEEALPAVRILVERGASTSDAVREVASSYGVSRRELYERVIGAGP